MKTKNNMKKTKQVPVTLKQRLHGIRFSLLIFLLVTLVALAIMLAWRNGSPLAFISIPTAPRADTVAAGDPTWRDEFNGNSLSYATDGGGGTWRTKGYESGALAGGYGDYAGSSWNASQDQIKKYGLATVSDGVLTLKTKRNPGIYTDGAKWIGPYLVSNHKNNLTWRYGYFEWRMSLPNTARGMFPAIWLFNNVPGRSNGYEGAELDMLEVFGSRAGVPWEAGLHFKPKELSGVNHKTAAREFSNTSGWHRYGINWTSSAITYYKDGAVVGRVTGPAATWYQHANLGVRMNYAMDPNWKKPAKGKTNPEFSTATDPAAGTTPTMKIDYIRYYKQKP